MMIADYTVSESLLCKSFYLKLSSKLNVSVKIFHRETYGCFSNFMYFEQGSVLNEKTRLIISNNKGLFMRKQAHFQTKPPITANYTIILVNQNEMGQCMKFWYYRIC